MQSIRTRVRAMMSRTRVVILGAAGRDFHDFNVVYRDDPRYEVVAFTATQIPNIDGRIYPPSSPARCTRTGIPIVPESELEPLVARASDRRGRLRLLRRLARGRHAHGLAGAGRRRRLPAARRRDARCSARTGRSSRCARCAPAAARARPRATSPALLRDAGQARRRAPPPDALRRPGRAGRAALRDPTRTWSAADAPSRSARSTSRTSTTGDVVFAGVDYERILRAPRTRPTSCCGTAATTTCRSSGPT